MYIIFICTLTLTFPVMISLWTLILPVARLATVETDGVIGSPMMVRVVGISLALVKASPGSSTMVRMIMELRIEILEGCPSEEAGGATAFWVWEAPGTRCACNSALMAGNRQLIQPGGRQGERLS